MKFQLQPYSDSDASDWDQFISSTTQSTFIHTRKFLGYHGSRFKDKSLLIHRDGRLMGLFPAAEHPQEKSTIVSHPGVTFGGLLCPSNIRGELLLSALEQLIKHYRDNGYSKLIYKPVPYVYHSIPSQDDLYALFRLGAVRYRCDLSSVIDLRQSIRLADRRKRSLRKAKQSGIIITSGQSCLSSYWPVLTETLMDRHSTSPVHTLSEISSLANLFPREIQCICARRNTKIIAGVLLFNTPYVSHIQYSAATPEGRTTSALDGVLDSAISHARDCEQRWFDFGISTEEQGHQLNTSLYKFKNEFGSGGVVHEFYSLSL